MASDDITVQILREIRDDIRDLRSDTNKRFDDVSTRFDVLHAKLDTHIDASRIGFVEVHRAIKKSEFVTSTEIRETETRLEAARFRDRAVERQRLEQCEQAIANLADRVAGDE